MTEKRIPPGDVKQASLHVLKRTFIKDIALKYILLALLFASFTSCLSIKLVEFKKADHLLVKTVDNEPQIKFDILGHNPNNWSIRMTELQTKVTINGQLYANLQLDTVMRLKRKTDFSIPVSVNISEEDLKKLIPAGIVMLLTGEDIPINIKGDLILKKFIFRKKFSFQLDEKINPKMLIGF